MFSLNNIGKVEDQIGHPVLLSLAFLAILPISTAYIDCRISCRRCHENTEPPSVLEVYCAMCEECKQRRREKIQGRSGTTVSSGSVPQALAVAQVQSQSSSAPPPPPKVQPPPPTAPAPPAPTPPPQTYTPMAGRAVPARHRARMMRHGYEDDHDHEMHAYPLAPPMLMAPGIALGYPPGCPMPPLCSDSEEEVTLSYRPTPSTSTTTTTTTTTTPPSTTTCPPILHCRKKKRPEAYMPPMMPPMMMPCMPCMSMCPYPCQSMSTPASPFMLSQPPASASSVDFQYVYIGIPKSALRS